MHQWIWKGAGYEINTQKWIAFLYTKNERAKKAIRESIPFTIASKRIKYLGINFTEWVKDLYTESYNWWEKLKTTHKWKDILCSWTGIINIVKMRRLLKATCRFKAMPIKIPKAFFFFLEKESKLVWNHRSHWIAKTHPEKEEQS